MKFLLLWATGKFAQKEIHCVCRIISVGPPGLQVFYVIHEIKNMAMTDTFRILFVIGTFFFPYIGMPIYFIAYLWKDRQQEAQIVQASLEGAE